MRRALALVWLAACAAPTRAPEPEPEPEIPAQPAGDAAPRRPATAAPAPDTAAPLMVDAAPAPANDAAAAAHDAAGDVGAADTAPEPPAAVDPGSVVGGGWVQKDMAPNANWDGAMTGCPDPDAMVTKGTAKHENGVWTLTGSGEGFIHGWDQGNLVYFEKKVSGDFDFTAQITELAPDGAFKLNGAAEAVLNVRDGLDYKAPANSIIAGRMPGRTIFMGRFHWRNESPPNGAGSRTVENKVWYWPAWPETWPKEPSLEWVRISRRGRQFRAYVSRTGAEGDWQEVKNADTRATWYPYDLKTFGSEAILGLVCTARNDRNGAPRKANGCRDESSPLLRQAARCVFKNVSVVKR